MFSSIRFSMNNKDGGSLSFFLSQRGLCCFPSLTTKKPIQSLLADEVSVLSTNNSETFLQNLAHIGSDRRSEQPPERDQLSNGGQKADDMVLLEKQGRCSQKLRGGSSSSSGTLGNLAHVSQAVGQNMTDISNIGGSVGAGDVSSGGSGVSNNGNKVSKMLSGVSQQVNQRGSSLPPSALPRPPRSLKPPRKIEYGRLSDGGSDSGKKTRATTPPSPASSSSASQSGGSLKRGGREFSPAKGSYVEMKDTLQLTKDYQGGTTLKHKSYGSMTAVGTGGVPQPSVAKFGFGSSKSGTGTSGPSGDYPSTKNYQRLEDPSPTGSTAATASLGHRHNNSSSQSSQSRKSSGDSGTLKRSLLPNGGRKPNVAGGMAKGSGSRDSLNSASSGSNHSNVGAVRSSPQPQPHPAGSGYHPHQLASRTPPRFLQHHHQPSTSVESNKSHSNYHNMTTAQSVQQFHQGFFAKFPSPHAGSPVRTGHQPTQQHHPKTSSSLPSSSILHAAANSSATSAIGQASTASLPPKPSMLEKMVGGSSSTVGSQQQRRGSSLARVENKYRIQF
uniref:Uncharacterized protein n=1 Tax=Anopheles culicifacies TaxID=139723 RepID=A0A182M3F1_9DIPT